MRNAQVRTIRASRPPQQRRVAHATLFKLDRPRAIDRYIDYFGSSPGERARMSSANTLYEALIARTPA